MNALTQSLAQHLDEELESPVSRVTMYDAKAKRESLAICHRRSIWFYQQHMSDLAKAGEATVASLEAEMQAERDRHDREMSRLTQAVIASQQHTEREIEATTKLLASSEHALEALV